MVSNNSSLSMVMMPSLSPTMSEGRITLWNKKVGDMVRPGDVIAEIETDKTTLDFESTQQGVLLAILVPAQEMAVVQKPIAILGSAADLTRSVEELCLALEIDVAQPGYAPSDLSHDVAGPTMQSTEEHRATQQSSVAATTPQETQNTASREAEKSIMHSTLGRLKASPLARAVAKNKGIALEALQGSGPQGRILKKDVLAYSPTSFSVAKPQVSLVAQGTLAPSIHMAPSGFEPDYDTIALTPMRRAIAERLSASKQQIPHFYVEQTMDMTELLKAKQAWQECHQKKASVNDWLIYLVARAAMSVPQINSSYQPEGVRLYQQCDVAVAVSLEEGLITPVVRAACRKTLSDIASQTKELIDKAKKNTLKASEFQGGTITISNMGMYGVERFAAIVNPPQAAILAFGATLAKPVATEEHAIVIRPLMNVTLSVDHRAVDGSIAAEFLKVLKRYIETPWTAM